MHWKLIVGHFATANKEKLGTECLQKSENMMEKNLIQIIKVILQLGLV